jgi:hypothetical protein
MKLHANARLSVKGRELLISRVEVSGILTQIGMGKLGRLGLEPAQRYERQVPGKLIHIDVKKLGRIHDGALGIACTANTRPLQAAAHRR